MYRIVIEKAAEKQLSKIPSPHFNRIVKAIENLADNPRPAGYKKLSGRPGHRIRIGDTGFFIQLKTNYLLSLLLT